MKNIDINTEGRCEYNSGWQRISRNSETDKQIDIINKKIDEINSTFEKIQIEINDIKSIKEKINMVEEKLNELLLNENNMKDMEDICRQLEVQNSEYMAIEKGFKNIQREWSQCKQDFDTKISLLSLVIDSLKVAFENAKTEKRNTISEIFRRRR